MTSRLERLRAANQARTQKQYVPAEFIALAANLMDDLIALADASEALPEIEEVLRVHHQTPGACRAPHAPCSCTVIPKLDTIASVLARLTAEEEA